MCFSGSPDVFLVTIISLVNRPMRFKKSNNLDTLQISSTNLERFSYQPKTLKLQRAPSAVRRPQWDELELHQNKQAAVHAGW